MKQHRQELSAAAICAMCILCLFGTRGRCLTITNEGTVTPGYSASVSLFPLQSYIAPSELCTLQVFIEGTGDSVGCVECRITFDTALVTLLAAQEGQLFKKPGVPTFFRWESVAPDTQSVVDCLLGYRTYFLPPGELARFIFRGDQNGACPVRITYLKLWDIDRHELFPEVDPAAWIFIGTSTGSEPLPVEYGRLTSYPNPFSVSTTIMVPQPSNDDPSARHVRAILYNAKGQRISTLFDGTMAPGENGISWSGADQSGNRVPSGTYFVEARTPQAVFRAKLVLIQ